jgi:hypothetical protein
MDTGPQVLTLRVVLCRLTCAFLLERIAVCRRLAAGSLRICSGFAGLAWQVVGLAGADSGAGREQPVGAPVTGAASSARPSTRVPECLGGRTQGGIPSRPPRFAGSGPRGRPQLARCRGPVVVRVRLVAGVLERSQDSIAVVGAAGVEVHCRPTSPGPRSAGPPPARVGKPQPEPDDAETPFPAAPSLLWDPEHHPRPRRSAGVVRTSSTAPEPCYTPGGYHFF